MKCKKALPSMQGSTAVSKRRHSGQVFFAVVSEQLEKIIKEIAKWWIDT